MNKFTLSYIIFVNAAVITLAIANMISGNIFFKDIFFIINSILSIYCVFNVGNKYAYHYLCITNFIQAFSFILFGFAFKFLLGPDLSFYFYREGDLLTKLEFNIFNGTFIHSKDLNIDNWSIGINFIHLYIAFYLYSLISKAKAKISNVT
jgi:hypothetical protein